MNPVHIHHRLVCEYLYPNGAEEKDKEIGRIRTDMLQLIQVSMSTNICLIYMFRGCEVCIATETLSADFSFKLCCASSALLICE